MTRTDQNDLAGHHRLHAFLKRWFRTPGPWPSELLQRRAEVLHAAHLFVLFMSAVYLVVPRSVLNGQTIFVLATILVAAVGSGFLRRGWIHLSGIWTIGVMWLIFTLGSVTEGGLSSSSFGGSIAIILFAGLAFGLRMVIATAVMTIAAGVGIVYLQHASLLPHPAVTYSDLNVLSDFTVYFAITALFTGIAVRRIDTSTQRSEEEIAARKRSEDSLRDREAYMRSLIENINDIITVIDGTGKILYVSSSVERLLGYDPQTRLGENILHSIHPEDVPIARGLLTRGLAGTSPSSGVLLRYLHVDGTWRTLEISIKVTRNSDGSAMGVLTSRDVTERRRAEEQLEMNERRFRAIVEHSSEAFVLIRADGTVDYAGPTVARLTGYPSGEREGQQVFELVYADDRDAVRKQFADLVKRPGGVISMVFRSVRKDGTVWWMEATGTNMLHAPGVGAIVLNYRDVTERKKAEEALSESEERFRSLYENSTVGIYRTTPDGRVLLANPSLVQMLGHSSFEELAARNLEQGEFEAGYARSSFIMQVERDGEVRGLESRWTTRSGGNIYVRESARAVRDASGRTLFYDGIVEDISERKRAEERIEQLALQQENILETITAGIVHLKLGRATWANSAFAAMFGLQDVAIADVDAGSLFADKGAYEQIRSQVSARYGTAVHLASEMEMLRRDGTHFWCAVVGRSIDPESLAAGSIWMFQDITDRRNAEDSRLALERQLIHTQKLESLGVLAGGIAHDFNNLLQGIIGNISLVRSRLDPGDRNIQTLERAERSADRAAELTQQMLAYSGRGHFVVSRLDINEMLRENADLFRSSIARTVTVELLPASGRMLIEADRSQVQQIVMNLITNASEAIQDRPGTIRLTSGLMQCSAVDLQHSRLPDQPPPGRFAYLEVADTGCGMDEETQHRLFEPFYTTKFTGRGLGMSAVLGIVKGHRGAIFVDTDIGRGTTIRVLFPALDADATLPEGTSTPAGQGQTLMPKERVVLVVDDEEPVRDLCIDFISTFGMQSLAASNGVEGVEVFRRHAEQISCVLLDLTMPHMDGAEAFRRMRELKPDVRVILASGYNEREVEQRFAHQGVAAFIQKPFRLEQLREKIAGVLVGPRSPWS